MSNMDVYVTGSNSKFLSSDIVTEFRGRGDEIRIYPLSFAEFYSVYSGDYDDTFDATEEEVLPYFEKVENFIKDMEALITHK